MPLLITLEPNCSADELAVSPRLLMKFPLFAFFDHDRLFDVRGAYRTDSPSTGIQNCSWTRQNGKVS